MLSARSQASKTATKTAGNQTGNKRMSSPLDLSDSSTKDHNKGADPAFAKRLLGWEAKQNLDEMLVDAWRWQRQNPQGYCGDVESA